MEMLRYTHCLYYVFILWFLGLLLYLLFFFSCFSVLVSNFDAFAIFFFCFFHIYYHLVLLFLYCACLSLYHAFFRHLFSVLSISGHTPVLPNSKPESLLRSSVYFCRNHSVVSNRLCCTVMQHYSLCTASFSVGLSLYLYHEFQTGVAF